MHLFRVTALIAKGDEQHSSSRTVGEVARIFDEASRIWSQAEVGFAAEVLEWRPEPRVLAGLVEAARARQPDTDSLIAVAGEKPRRITAVYVRSIGGSSGKVFRPKRTVLVVDETKVSDSRTTAHEIGHIFGLEHWLDHPPPGPSDRSPSQLMARTQPGTELTPRDIEWVKRSLPALGLEEADEARA